jgi:hypothetical protein
MRLSFVILANMIAISAHAQCESVQKQLEEANEKAAQERSQMQSEVARLTEKLNNRAPLRWKHGNSGTVNCDTYCQGPQWGGFSSKCVASEWLIPPIGYGTCRFPLDQTNRVIACLCQEP